MTMCRKLSKAWLQQVNHVAFSSRFEGTQERDQLFMASYITVEGLLARNQSISFCLLMI